MQAHSALLFRVHVCLLAPDLDVLLDELDLMLDLFELLALAPALEAVECIADLLVQLSQRLLLLLLDLVHEDGLIQVHAQLHGGDVLRLLQILHELHFEVAVLDRLVVKILSFLTIGGSLVAVERVLCDVAADVGLQLGEQDERLGGAVDLEELAQHLQLSLADVV